MPARPQQQVPIDTLEDLRAWLAAHHAQAESVWLVLWKRTSGRVPIPYPAIVREALCWGWVDSLPRRLDAERSLLRLSPRRAGSAWSAINKAHVAALLEAGRMMPPGLAAIARARADGTWAVLDGAETLAIPPDLAAALDAVPDAARNFAAFPKSSRRGILEWIMLARRPETRARRIAETASLAGRNLKANHPAGRNAGPTAKAPRA